MVGAIAPWLVQERGGQLAFDEFAPPFVSAVRLFQLFALADENGDGKAPLPPAMHRQTVQSDAELTADRCKAVALAEEAVPLPSRAHTESARFTAGVLIDA